MQRDRGIYPEVENIVRDRLKRTDAKIEDSLKNIAEGNPLASERDVSRRIARLQSKAALSREEAVLISFGDRSCRPQSIRARGRKDAWARGDSRRHSRFYRYCISGAGPTCCRCSRSRCLSQWWTAGDGLSRRAEALSHQPSRNRIRGRCAPLSGAVRL